MSDLRKAAQMALDAIDVYGPDYMHGLPKKKYVDALRAALAQPERKPLTDADIKGIVDVGLQTWKLSESTYEFARAVEKAHGIGGES